MSMPGGGSPVGAAVPVGGLLRLFPSGGGTTFDQALAGSLTPAGALDIRVLLLANVEGSLTPAGALSKVVRKGLAGSFAATGALAKKVRTSLAGSITPSGALVRLIGKRLAGSITPTGDVWVTWRQALSGSITVTGALVANYLPGGAVFVDVTRKVLRLRRWRGGR